MVFLVNNKPEQIERFEFMQTGWQRRSMLYLDAAGCPAWLIERRCPRIELPYGLCWGDLLDILVNEITVGGRW
jgi:hypothetical protein